MDAWAIQNLCLPCTSGHDSTAVHAAHCTHCSQYRSQVGADAGTDARLMSTSKERARHLGVLCMAQGTYTDTRAGVHSSIQALSATQACSSDMRHTQGSVKHRALTTGYLEHGDHAMQRSFGIMRGEDGSSGCRTRPTHCLALQAAAVGCQFCRNTWPCSDTALLVHTQL